MLTTCTTAWRHVICIDFGLVHMMRTTCYSTKGLGLTRDYPVAHRIMNMVNAWCSIRNLPKVRLLRANFRDSCHTQQGMMWLIWKYAQLQGSCWVACIGPSLGRYSFKPQQLDLICLASIRWASERWTKGGWHRTTQEACTFRRIQCQMLHKIAPAAVRR